MSDVGLLSGSVGFPLDLPKRFQYLGEDGRTCWSSFTDGCLSEAVFGQPSGGQGVRRNPGEDVFGGFRDLVNVVQDYRFEFGLSIVSSRKRLDQITFTLPTLTVQYRFFFLLIKKCMTKNQITIERECTITKWAPTGMPSRISESYQFQHVMTMSFLVLY